MPTATPTASATPQPPATTPTLSPTPTPTPEPWKITNVNADKTASTLNAKAPNTAFTLTASQPSNCFLITSFSLTAQSQDKTLLVQDVLLTVDGTQIFYPVCFPEVFGDFNGTYPAGLTSEFHNFALTYPNPTLSETGIRFNGNITSQQASFSVRAQDGAGGSLTISWKTNSTSTFRFVYDLPKTYLDGTHNIQLKIAGSSVGLVFTISP